MPNVSGFLILVASVVFGCSRHTEPTRADVKTVVEPVLKLSASAQPSLAPAQAFQAIVGCWKLSDRERWQIVATPRGAEVTRELLDEVELKLGDYASRAAQPSRLIFDEQQQAYGFVTAGRIHAQLFSFRVVEQKLEGSWAVSRAPGSKFEPQAGSVQLSRCDAP